jgi:hypothetical protein
VSGSSRKSKELYPNGVSGLTTDAIRRSSFAGASRRKSFTRGRPESDDPEPVDDRPASPAPGTVREDPQGPAVSDTDSASSQ